MRTFEFSTKGYEEMKNYREYLGGLIKINDVKAAKRRAKVSLLLMILMATMIYNFVPGSMVAFSTKDFWLFDMAMKFTSKSIGM